MRTIWSVCCLTFLSKFIKFHSDAEKEDENISRSRYLVFHLFFHGKNTLTSDECANVAALRSSSCAHDSEFNLIFQNLPPGMNYERVTQMKNMKTLPRRRRRSKVKLTRLPTRAGKMKEEKKKENLKSSFVSDEKCVCCFFLVYRRQALLTLARRAATYIEINLCKSHDDRE